MGAPKGHAKSGGRQAGTPNKTTKTLKDAILEAAKLAGGEPSADSAGGLVGYLVALATGQPQAFAGLLGKVLPLTLAGEGQDGALVVEIRRFSPKAD